MSCVSAGAVMAHLDTNKYEVIPVGISLDGAWMVGESDPEKLTIVDRTLPKVEPRDQVRLSIDPSHRGEFRYISGPHTGELYATADVVFPVLHGRFGEDGTIQGFFELSSVPFVGAGVLASANAVDKEFTKKLLAAEGLPVAREVILRRRAKLTEQEKDLLGLPVFVKPARGGSSIGVSKVTSWDPVRTRAARSAASTRVRFCPGMGGSCLQMVVGKDYAIGQRADPGGPGSTRRFYLPVWPGWGDCLTGAGARTTSLLTPGTM